MKKIVSILFISLFFLNGAVAQKLNEYKASNGITYLIGDTVTLGVGSACDGFFSNIYSSVALTRLMAFVEEQGYDPRLPSDYEGSKVVVLKIRLVDEKIYLTFTSDDLGNFVIDIEAAIKSCEVAYCQPDGFLSQQQFEKLVLLYQACLNQKVSTERFQQLRKEMLGAE